MIIMPKSATIKPIILFRFNFSLNTTQPITAVITILIALDTGNSITESTVLPSSVTKKFITNNANANSPPHTSKVLLKPKIVFCGLGFSSSVTVCSVTAISV